MALREKRVDGVVPGIECDRVRTPLGRHGLDTTHGVRLEHVNHARIPDRDVQAAQRGIEEDDVRPPTQFRLAQDPACPRIQDKEDLASTQMDRPAALA